MEIEGIGVEPCGLREFLSIDGHIARKIKSVNMCPPNIFRGAGVFAFAICLPAVFSSFTAQAANPAGGTKVTSVLRIRARGTSG